MNSNNLEIVLYHPQIPQNTGNIGRLCVNSGTALNLIEPLGFSLDDKYVKRSGLDYWKYLNLKVHKSWEEFEKSVVSESLYFFSTKTERLFWECPYQGYESKNQQITPSESAPTYLVFGCETSGLSEDIYNKYNDRLYTIPMIGEHARSYNLSNSVSTVLFEGLRRSWENRK